MKIKGLHIILLLILVSSCSYILHYSLQNIISFDLAKTINITMVLGIFSVALLGTLQTGKIVRFLPLDIYALLIFWVLIIGIFSNSLVEILPSFFRFSMYYLLVLLTYQYIENNGLPNFDDSIRKFTLLLVVISLVFGYYEVFFGKIKFMNGAYRLSGSFKQHPLAYSMFLGVVIILWIEYFLRIKKSIWNILILLGLAYLFINTHSRMPLLFLIISYVAYSFLKLKKIVKALKVVFVIIIVGILSYTVIVTTEIAPRLRTVFVSKNSLKDPSTRTRIAIMENTFNGMNSVEKVFGIGIGGFNNFYKGISGKDGVAAHNNFLLFYAEGGYIGLFLFLLYQILLFRVLFRFIRRVISYESKINYQRLIFVIVFLFEICSFLLNNYYFFTSQAVVFICMGVMIYLIRNTQRNEQFQTV